MLTGDWLSVNGDAIYDTKPWIFQNDTLTGDVWYTQSSKSETLYASMLSWPKDNILRLGSLKLLKTAQLFLLERGRSTELTYTQLTDILKISLPAEAHRGQPAWVISFKSWRH